MWVFNILLVLVALAACASCTEREAAPPPSTRLAEPSDAIDQDLMIALSQAKNYHHKAKIFMSDGKLDDAIASVREILSLKFPAGAPEADDVRADARALLAKLYLGKGQLDDAARIVEEGIAASPRKSFFVANLYTVQGEVHEARAAQLDAAHDPKAAAEKRAAIESYDTSIQIDAQLQKKLMEDK